MITPPKISIVVPVYKVENYLHKCVDSLLAQTFTDFEVLLIDDGSPDKSGEICDEYAAKDTRVRVFHKNNEGVTAARRWGLKNSIGEWITFVDSDDTLPATSLADLWYEAETGKYDIIIGRFDKGKFEKYQLTVEENRAHAIAETTIQCGACGRLISRNLFDEETLNIPRSISVGEDMLMHVRLAFRNKKPVRLLGKKIYNYEINPGSVTNTFHRTFEYEMLFYSYLKESIPSMEYPKYIRELVSIRLGKILKLWTLYKKNVWFDSDFFNELLSDIHLTHYPLNMKKRIILMTKKPILHKFYFLCFKIRDGLFSR